MDPENLYDLSTVKEFVGDNPEQIRGLVMIFVEDVPEMLEKLNTGKENGDWDEVKFFAHKLKSSIDLFRISPIQQVIRDIEMIARERKELERIPPLLERVNITLDQALIALRNDFNL
ncbi:MAG: Hpt domain-containing protein [Bacteroidales bacterium]